MRVTNKRVSKRTCARGGEKRVVEKRIQEILADRERRYGKKGEEIRSEILNGLKPVIETKSVKRSGRSQQVPKRVSKSRGTHRACRWIQDAAKKRAKKRGCTRKDGRRRELGRVYEELRGIQKGGSGRKIQSEPRLIRDRRHRAAKANRVNVS
jgi:ribosomal protein S7